MFKKKNSVGLILSSVFILALITDWYRLLVVVLNLYLVYLVLEKLGKGIVLRELMALHSAFICLLMPMVGYLFYDQSNHLARLWVKYMFVPEETYFGFALPAISGYCAAMCWPFFRSNEKDEGRELMNLIERSKKILQKRPSIGIYLMIFGVISFYFGTYLPVVLQFAVGLFFFAAFSGFLYVYFLPKLKRKVLILTVFASFIFFGALQSGMFTVVAYMGITIVSFFFVGRKISMVSKVSVFVIGLFFTFMLQTVKLAYRQHTWGQEYEGNRVALFLQVIKEQWESNSNSNISDAFFPIYTRGNQGFNVAMVMRRIPLQQDFDGGRNLFINLVSSFVPRVFWPDKPEAGGKFNMKFYVGMNIEGWSTNIGPLGEAYGSFGVQGGIIFMIVLGFLIRWTYQVVIRQSYKIPLLLFWIPVIYYQVTYAAESDTLQILNSIIKSAFFIWILFRFRPGLFGVVRLPFAQKKRYESSRKKMAVLNAKPGISTSLG